MVLAISKKPALLLAVLLPAVLLTACGSTSSPLTHPLTAVTNIQLPAEPTVPAIDLLTIDPRVGRLYISHTSIGAMDVLDTKARKLIGSVPGLPGIKAIALTSDPNLVFVSQSIDQVAAVDLATMKVVATIPAVSSPDAIAYDSVANLVVVSLSGSSKVGLIDPTSEKLVGEISFAGSPELMSIDAATGYIYLAINDLSEVDVFNPATKALVKTYKGCDLNKPTGVAFDGEDGRVFIASHLELNVIDVLLDKCLGIVDIGSGTDQIAYNPHTHHLYTADGGSQYISVIDAVSLKPLGTVGTGRQASTLATDPYTDDVFVAVKPAGIVAVYHDP